MTPMFAVMSPNQDIMTEKNYYIYCNAWCAINDPETTSTYWCYPEYQYAGDNGIIFG